jgi:hypothetical protein
MPGIGVDPDDLVLDLDLCAPFCLMTWETLSRRRWRSGYLNFLVRK